MKCVFCQIQSLSTTNDLFSFQNFYSGEAKLQENDGLQLVKEMATDVSNMMKFKVDAVNVSVNAMVWSSGRTSGTRFAMRTDLHFHVMTYMLRGEKRTVDPSSALPFHPSRVPEARAFAWIFQGCFFKL